MWAKLILILGVVLAVASGAVLVGGRLLIRRYEGTVRHEDLLGAAAAPQRDDGDKGLVGPLNVLLIGLDWRQGDKGLIRSDTIMVMHVPRGVDRAFLVSIPRDLYVDIPAFPASGYHGGRDKINAAFAYGAGDQQNRPRGAQLLAQTMKNLTGVPGFDAAAIIDFYGFANVVQALGGVNMCVDVDTRSIHRKGVVYRKGCYKMDGESALDYVRQRKSLSDGDYGRQRHQQQFIKAMVKEAAGTSVTTNPVKLDAVLRAAGNSLTIADGGVPLSEWAFALRGVSSESIQMVRTPGTSLYGANKKYLGEQLEPPASELFQALKDDTLDAFLALHPELVNH